MGPDSLHRRLHLNSQAILTIGVSAFVTCGKDDLDRWRRYGRSVTVEPIPNNLPYGRRRSARSRPGDDAVWQGFNSFRRSRQNGLPISDAFLTTSHFTSHNPASPRKSRDAPRSTESPIDAGAVKMPHTRTARVAWPTRCAGHGGPVPQRGWPCGRPQLQWSG